MLSYSEIGSDFKIVSNPACFVCWKPFILFSLQSANNLIYKIMYKHIYPKNIEPKNGYKQCRTLYQ